MTSHFDSNHRFYFLSGGAVGVGKDSQFEMGEATRYGSAAQRTPPHPLYAVVVLSLLVFGFFFDYDVRARWSAKVSVSECRLKDSGRKRPLASPLTETAWKQLLPRQEPGLPYSRRPHSPRLHLFYFPSIPFPPFLHAHAHLPKVGADSRLRTSAYLELIISEAALLVRELAARPATPTCCFFAPNYLGSLLPRRRPPGADRRPPVQRAFPAASRSPPLRVWADRPDYDLRGHRARAGGRAGRCNRPFFVVQPGRSARDRPRGNRARRPLPRVHAPRSVYLRSRVCIPVLQMRRRLHTCERILDSGSEGGLHAEEIGFRS